MPPSNYGLIICEKPDAAKRVAEALAFGKPEVMKIHGVEFFACNDGQKNYVVCSALGHLYVVSDSYRRRDVYPTFDIEWFPADLIDRRYARVRGRILAIRKLASDADFFVNACDFDVEGEAIGYNLLKYACGGKEKVARRAKFSTLTKEELVEAISKSSVGASDGLANAGRTRHVLDFVWGINISRALAASLATADSGYHVLSMGRVQGPTLAFVVEKEIAVRSFVPTPYWKVRGLFRGEGTPFEASHETARFSRRVDAESVKSRCEGKAGLVSSLSRSVFKEPPPTPFDTGDLQKEAYRVFGYSPSKTMQLAQRLYLDAAISYPRTSSKKLPATIKYSNILSKLAGLEEYSGYVGELMLKELKPREGEQVDRAHPAIYPTGERPRRVSYAQELRVFDLITRRFLACFAPDAIRERVSASVSVGMDKFGLSGSRTLKSGWIRYYKYARIEDRPIPPVSESDVVAVTRIDCDEMFESRPLRFNQSSLLERMEKEGIGTKATRAEIISTLFDRAYITGKSIEATDLGLSVVEIMREYSPQIISVSLTREVERELEEIEAGRGDETELIETSIGLLVDQMALLKVSEREIGLGMARAAKETVNSQGVIGSCPVCGTGKLRIVRSAKTRKRFVGCTNYSQGCRASAPLPQKGVVIPTGVSCEECGWPLVYVRFGRRPWKLCVNVRCKRRERGSDYGMQSLRAKN